MLKRKLEVFGKRLFVTGIVLGLFLAGCAGNPQVTSDAGAVEKEEVVDSKEGDVLQEQEVQAEDERQEEPVEVDSDSQESDVSQETSETQEKEDEQLDPNDTEGDGEIDWATIKQDMIEQSFTDSQVQDIYNSIGKAVKSKYLDQNGIDPNEFEWPKSLDVDGVDEDNSWLYLNYICVEYISTGKLYSTENFGADLPSDQHQKLMNSVLDGMIEWDQSSGNNDFNLITLALIPMEEKIPANVNFSD